MEARLNYPKIAPDGHKALRNLDGYVRSGTTELLDLTFAVSAINAWNRMSISFRSFRGSINRKPARQEKPIGKSKRDDENAERNYSGPPLPAFT